FMLGAGVVEVGELVERELAVASSFAQKLRALAVGRVARQFIEMLQFSMPRFGRIARVQTATAGKLLQRGVQHAWNQAVFGALMEVAHLPELLANPAALD